MDIVNSASRVRRLAGRGPGSPTPTPAQARVMLAILQMRALPGARAVLLVRPLPEVRAMLPMRPLPGACAMLLLLAVFATPSLLVMPVAAAAGKAVESSSSAPHSSVLQSTAADSAEGPPSGMAGRLIAHFKMQLIPQEGAWFAVTYTSEDVFDGALLPPRYAGHPHAAGGAIVALVTARDFSAMHRLETDEVWHFYGGAPLELTLLYPDGKGRTVKLGKNVLGGEFAQFTVPKGVWQGAAPGVPDGVAHGARYGVPYGVPVAASMTGNASRYSFVGTQMAPGFDPTDFEIGYRDALERRYPAFAKRIGRLTRAEFAHSPAPPGGSMPQALPGVQALPDVPAQSEARAQTDMQAQQKVHATEQAGAQTQPGGPATLRAFTAEDVPAVTLSPGVTLRELVGRVAPLATTSTLSVATFTLSPGRSSGTSFNHRSQEVFLVVDGTGTVHVGDEVTPVHAGSTVFIPAGEVHSIDAGPDGALTFYAVSAPAFSPEDYLAVKPK